MTKEERAEIAKAQSAARSRNYRERERKKKEIIIVKAKSEATSRTYREQNKQKHVSYTQLTLKKNSNVKI